MNRFANAARAEGNVISTAKLTENGALARTTSGDNLVDLFATIGALRPRTDNEIISKFQKAWNEDKMLAWKMVFYARNIRGGLGERRTPRVIMKWMARAYPETMKRNFANVAKFGRFDDFYEFVGTPIERDMWAYLKATIYHDMEHMELQVPISLCAKWLKSTNTHSQESVKLGRMTAKAFGLTEREYRKMLSKMRKYIDVVERKMSANEWDKIHYSAVPSYAMKKYHDAFRHHCPNLFDNYIAKVERGEETIKAATLYPYDLVHKYMNGSTWYSSLRNEIDRTIEAQWKALPNYIDGNHNVLVMADVSGSMMGRPMETSIGLAIYFAERNHGDFANLYMTFTNAPHFIEVKGGTLRDNVNTVMRTDVGYNTDLEAAFWKILRTAISNHVPPKDMPKALVVISDMEIDHYFRNSYELDFVTAMRARFRQAGYDLPKLIMWNVEARNDTFHAKANNPYVQFISGQSASSFKSLLGAIETDAYGLMVKTLNDKMYDSVVL